MNDEIVIVYFSGVTNMTEKLVKRLGFESYRIPIYRTEPDLEINKDYILVTSTMGGGNATQKKNAVPKQVIRFLNNENNRNHCLAVIGGGNKNFGRFYAEAAKIIAKKLNVPFLSSFELAGLPGEDIRVKNSILDHWSELKEISEQARIQEI